jgi:hypothetical protein
MTCFSKLLPKNSIISKMQVYALLGFTQPTVRSLYIIVLLLLMCKTLYTVNNKLVFYVDWPFGCLATMFFFFLAASKIGNFFSCVYGTVLCAKCRESGAIIKTL